MTRIVTVLMAAILLVQPARGQVQFNEVESADELEALYARASSENKNLFVDVYATWCGPCKWMDANVFDLEEAGRYMNSECINVKIDGDGDYGYTFARENGLEAYPSFFVFNTERQLMNKIVGAKPWGEFESALTSTLEYYPVLELLQKKYESGVLQRDEFARFVEVLGKMGKEKEAAEVAMQYSGKYLRDENPASNTLSDYDIRVIAMHTPVSGDHWDLITNDPGRLQSVLGPDFEAFVDRYYNHSLLQAVESDDLEPVEQLEVKLADLTAGSGIDPQEIGTRAHVLYYSYTGRFKELSDYIDTQYREKHKGDHEWLFKAAVDAVFVDPNNAVMVEKGLDWFAECIRLQPKMEYYYHLAYCQYLMEENQQAIATFEKALQLAGTDEERTEIEGIITQLKSETE